MTAIRNLLDKMETESELKEMLSTAIAEWLETATVDRANYPEKYHNAIQSQKRIRWQHIFAGKLVQGWGGYTYKNTKHKHADRKETRYITVDLPMICLLYTSPSPRDPVSSRMPSSA